MNDLPSSIRLQQSSARPRTGEELETFGKEAATKFVRGEYSTLTEAVVETVKSAGLAPEQVRRVVEFTNIDAFNQEFRKEAAGHRVVEFKGGPASFSDVLKDLNDGSVGELDKHAFDYSLPPPSVGTLYSLNEDRLGLDNVKLAEAFGVEEVPLPYADPTREAEDLRTKLAGAEEELSAELSFLEGQYLDTVEGLYGAVKQAALEGTHLGQIVSAWGSVLKRPEFVKAAFQQLTPRLIEGGVFRTREEISDSLVKTASRGLVNAEHPIMVHFCDFCETLTKLAETRAAHQEIAEGLDKISTFLKAAGLVDGGIHAAKQLWGASTTAARAAAPQVGSAIRGAAPGIGGAVSKATQVAGDVAEKALPYAPHAALGFAGATAYRKTKESPTVQRVLSYVPGTQQNAVRKYYAQGGQ